MQCFACCWRQKLVPPETSPHYRWLTSVAHSNYCSSLSACRYANAPKNWVITFLTAFFKGYYSISGLQFATPVLIPASKLDKFKVLIADITLNWFMLIFIAFDQMFWLLYSIILIVWLTRLHHNLLLWTLWLIHYLQIVMVFWCCFRSCCCNALMEGLTTKMYQSQSFINYVIWKRQWTATGCRLVYVTQNQQQLQQQPTSEFSPDQVSY